MDKIPFIDIKSKIQKIINLFLGRNSVSLKIKGIEQTIPVQYANMAIERSDEFAD